MSLTTITLTFKQGGVLTDQQSVVFADPGTPATIGVQRTDTNANVVPVNTPLARKSLGVYQYQFTDPAPGLTYNYWITDTPVTGAVIQFEQTIAGGTGNATSPYFTYTDFVNEFGLNNIVLWSNKDSYSKMNPVPNWVALQSAFDYASDEITDAFRMTQYVTPLDFTPNDGTIPPMVKNWAMTIAGWKLYRSRGFEEKNKVESRFDRQRREVYDDMALHRCGLRRLNASIRTDTCAGDLTGHVVTVTDVFTACTNNNWGWVYADGVPVYNFVHS